MELSAFLHHHQAHVNVTDTVDDGLDHIIAQLVLRLVHTGGIGEDQLRFAVCPGVHHTHDLASGGLRLRRHDGDLLPQKPVEQRGFSHIRLADNGNERGFGNGMVFVVFQKAQLHISYISATIISQLTSKEKAFAGFLSFFKK